MQGELVQKLLCRWWYAMEWPAKQDVIPAPANYVALEGYPGVYVCVEVGYARARVRDWNVRKIHAQTDVFLVLGYASSEVLTLFYAILMGSVLFVAVHV